MIAGHFGLAAAVKSRQTTTPMWALMFATIWLDIVFVPLFASGIEGLEKIAGTGPYGGAVIHADYSHSLVGAAILSVALGTLAAWVWGSRSGAVVGLMSFSHWLLDLVVHRADLPLLPGNAGDLPKFGFGLWRSPAAASAVELALVVGGALLYWRAADGVAVAAGKRRRLAAVSGLMAVGFGCLILALDVTGLAG